MKGVSVGLVVFATVLAASQATSLRRRRIVPIPIPVKTTVDVPRLFKRLLVPPIIAPPPIIPPIPVGIAEALGESIAESVDQYSEYLRANVENLADFVQTVICEKAEAFENLIVNNKAALINYVEEVVELATCDFVFEIDDSDEDVSDSDCSVVAAISEFKD